MKKGGFPILSKLKGKRCTSSDQRPRYWVRVADRNKLMPCVVIAWGVDEPLTASQFADVHPRRR